MRTTKKSKKSIDGFLNVNNYLFDLILPKCNMVLGNSFSSVYIQILMNINNDVKEASWKRNKCWMGTGTMAKNINISERRVVSLLKDMETIGLIKKTYRGKLYMFSLVNNNMSTGEDIFSLNIDIESKLLKLLNEKKRESTLKKFNIINNIFKYGNNYHYNNLRKLREWITKFEKERVGSSLMFITFFANSFITPNSSNSIIKNVSEKEMAKRLGVSQPTISRNLKSFENYLNLQYETNKKVSKIIVNKEMLNMDVNVVKETFKCPVCNKEVDSIKKLNSHVKRCKDEYHVLFANLQNETDSFTIESINELYDINKDKFKKPQSRKKSGSKEENAIAIELVKYFYELTGTRCPSWPKEISIIRSHLKNGLTKEEVIETMRYMSRRSYQDLKFFGNSINDALTIRQCKKDVKIEGTDSFLVKQFFQKTGQSLNDRLMLQAIKKINELKNSNYTYDQIKTIVEYMIDKKCLNFNFIVNMANEALQKSKDKNEMAKAYSTEELVAATLDGILEYGIIMMKDSNYDVAKKEIILRLKDDICSGKVQLTKVNSIYNKFAVALAREVYRRSLYDINLTPQQWIDKTQLNVVNARI